MGGWEQLGGAVLGGGGGRGATIVLPVRTSGVRTVMIVVLLLGEDLLSSSSSSSSSCCCWDIRTDFLNYVHVLLSCDRQQEIKMIALGKFRLLYRLCGSFIDFERIRNK